MKPTLPHHLIDMVPDDVLTFITEPFTDPVDVIDISTRFTTDLDHRCLVRPDKITVYSSGTSA